MKERFTGQLSIKYADVEIDYTNGRLGEGSCGVVYKCNFLGREAAAKIFGRCQDSSRKDVQNEVNLLARLQHPNVVQLIGHTFNETQEVIVLERMDTNLENYLTSCMSPYKRGPPLPLLGAVDIMLHIAEGMNYVHEHHVVHRDLKPGNVLITVVKDVENLGRSWTWHVKITDFGLSKLKEGSQYSTLDVGTRAFMAPEVFDVKDNKDKNYTKAADVYSYAMIFFEVLTGKLPYEGVPRGEIFGRIKKGKRPNLPSEAYCPEYLSAFIRRCWAAEAKERPGFPDICQMLVYCKELILRDSFPSPSISIVENVAQKLSSFLGLKRCIGKLETKLINDTRKTLVLYEEASNAAQTRICVLERQNEESAAVLETNPDTKRTNVAGNYTTSFFVHSVDPYNSYSTLQVWCGKKAVLGVSTDEILDNDVITIRQDGNAFIKHCKPRYEIFTNNSNN